VRRCALPAVPQDWLIDAFEAKVTSVFCIEPPG
jgi:hypothetical protein